MMSKKRNGREPAPEPRRYEIQFTRAAERELASLPGDDLRRVDAAILGLADDQHPPGSKKLKGVEDLYRIRVGDYRVIYTVESKRLVVLVVNVGNRRDIYRSL
jgi:mRNA interferase RelE/StbE